MSSFCMALSVTAWGLANFGQRKRKSKRGRVVVVVMGLHKLRGSKANAAKDETRFLTRNSDPKSSASLRLRVLSP